MREGLGHRQRRVAMVIALVCGVFAAGVGFSALLRSVGSASPVGTSGGAESTAVIGALQRDLAMFDERHRVDQGALDMLRQQLAVQQQELEDLQMALQFYRQLMAPESLPQGVAVRQIEVVETTKIGQFRYRVLVQQEASQHADADGELQVVLAGSNGAVDIELALDSLDSESGPALPLSFRYFQAIDGTLTLPEGFVPDRFRVRVTVRSPQGIDLEQQFPWRVRPRFSHVGQ